MATNGISVKGGITTPNIEQAEVKAAMINMAEEVIVLCDSSKIGNNSFVQVHPITAIDRIITDEGINENDLNEFITEGILCGCGKIKVIDSYKKIWKFIA